MEKSAGLKPNLKAQIYDALLEAKNKLPVLKANICGKDTIVFLGRSRSGKSTLVNYLLQTDLEVKLVRNNLYKIKEARVNGYGPQIGQGTLSKTTVPGFYKMNDLVLIDAPGFDDNRGEAQDIINAIYVNEIRHSQTCKIVLVVDIQDIINDNISGFITSIKRVNELIPHIDNLKKSISLVLTKDNSNYTADEIVQKLRTGILDVSNLNIEEKDRKLINCFVQNAELIAFFKMPSYEGRITREIDVNIWQAILESSALDFRQPSLQVGYVIASEVRIILHEVCRQFVDGIKFENELNRIAFGFEDFNNPDYISVLTEDDLLLSKSNLTNLLSKLEDENGTLNLEKLLDSLSSLTGSDNGADVYKILKLFSMLDKIKLMDVACKHLLIDKYKHSLHDLRSKVTEFKIKIENEEKVRKARKIKVIVCLATIVTAVAGIGIRVIFNI